MPHPLHLARQLLTILREASATKPEKLTALAIATTLIERGFGPPPTLGASASLETKEPELPPKPAKSPEAGSIDELNLSTRSYNCLKYAGFNTVSEIANRTDYELLAMKNFGRVSLAEVKEALAHVGLHLHRNIPL